MATTPITTPLPPLSGTVQPWRPVNVPANPLDNAVNPNQPSGIQSALSFLGTPGGAAVTNLAGGALSAYGQYQQSQQNLQQNANQFAATSAQNQYNADQANNLAKTSGVLNADPLGADQKYSQKNAIAAAILPNLRNARSTPGDPGVAAAMGGNRGGIMNALPANGFDPAMVNSMFGPDATMQAIQQRHAEINNLDPNAPTPDLTKTYGAAAAPVNQQMQDYQSKLQNLSATQRQDFETKMNGYIQNMVAQEGNNSGGFWHTFAKIAGTVGSIAAIALTGGAAAPVLGPVVGSLLAGGSAAAAAWGSGASPLSTAIAGGTGGAMSAIKSNQVGK